MSLRMRCTEAIELLPAGSFHQSTRIRVTVYIGGGMTMADAEVERIVNTVLNVVQLCFMAWLAARYHWGSGSKDE